MLLQNTQVYKSEVYIHGNCDEESDALKIAKIIARVVYHLH